MIYEYECEKCGVFEINQSMKEDALTKCPNCGCTKVIKLVTGGAGVIFKGSGFHCTDYPKQPRKDYKDVTKDERIERRKVAKKTLRDFSVKQKQGKV